MASPYTDAARALMALADPLATAPAARFDAPPVTQKQEHVTTSNGPSNPTLDITTNEKRLRLSAEVAAAEMYLTKITQELIRGRDRLILATDRFYHTDEDPT